MTTVMIIEAPLLAERLFELVASTGFMVFFACRMSETSVKSLTRPES